MMTHPKATATLTVLLLPVVVGCSQGSAGETIARQDTATALAATSSAAAGEPTLDEIRAVTARYRDIDAALAAGYIPDPAGMCVTAAMEGRPPSEGAMGIHYIRPDLLKLAGPPDPRVDGESTHTDFLDPGILIYEPQADGSLELVAVENLVFIEAWEGAGNDGLPSFEGIDYERMEDDPATDFDEAHGFEPHYDKHIWLYRDNPLGVYSPMNPNVTCEHHVSA